MLEVLSGIDADRYRAHVGDRELQVVFVAGGEANSAGHGAPDRARVEAT